MNPFSLSSDSSLPSVVKEEKFEEKLEGSCQKFLKLLTHEKAIEHKVSDRFVSYDVFISYAHKNVKKAEQFLTLLNHLDPKMKIFFDTKELRTGSSWQQSLYTAIDGSKVVIALLSKQYLSSQVCREEYNIALVQHMTQRTEIIPVLIENVEEIPQSFTHIPIINGVEKFKNVTMKICQSVDAYFQFKRKLEVFSPAETLLDVDKILEQRRLEFFGNHFKIADNKIVKTKPTCAQREKLPSATTNEQISDPLSLSVGHDLVFSFVHCDRKYAQFMCKYLKRRNPDLTISVDSESEQKKMLDLDNARLVLALLSPQYLRSPQGRDEFHVSLCKHRATKGRPILYPVQVAGLLPKPSYPGVIPCNVSCQDVLWRTIQFCGEIGTKNHPSLPQSQEIWSIIQNATFSGVTMWTPDMLAAMEGLDVDIPLKHVLPLTVACEDILDVLNIESTGYSCNEIIYNIMNLKNEWLTNDDIPFEPSFLKDISVPDFNLSDDEDEMQDPFKGKDASASPPPDHTQEPQHTTIKTRVSSSISDMREALLEPRNESENMSKAGDLMSEISAASTGKPSEISSTLSHTDSDTVSVMTDSTRHGAGPSRGQEEEEVAHLHYEPQIDDQKKGKVSGNQVKSADRKKSPKEKKKSAASRGSIASQDQSKSCQVL